MISFSSADSPWFVDNEGDTLTHLVNTWRQLAIDVHVGVVVYNDDVREIRDLGGGYPTPIIYNYTHHERGSSGQYELKPSGESDLAKALDFVRLNSFNNSRPGVPKVVIPIIHQMKQTSGDRQQIIDAGQKLIKECVSIVAITVDHRTLHLSTIEKAVNAPSKNHILSMKNYKQLECEACERLFMCGNNVQHRCGDAADCNEV